MKTFKFDFTFWFKILFLILVIGGYVSLAYMKPIHVSSVARSSAEAAESGLDSEIGFIAVKNSSIMRGNDGSCWVYLVKGNSVEKELVKLGVSNNDYVEITSGLLLKDSYILNPPKKDRGIEKFPVDWRFDN